MDFIAFDIVKTGTLARHPWRLEKSDLLKASKLFSTPSAEDLHVPDQVFELTSLTQL